jgi:GNAT superfamily N-acetyltransferase
VKTILNADTGLTLSPIQLTDQPELYVLMDEIYRNSYDSIWTDKGDWYMNLIYCPETLEKEIRRDRSHYFHVEVASRKIGILKYDFPFSPREIEIPNAMKLHRLYLHRDFHGKGIAQTLLIHCEEIAKKNMLSTIWLEVMSFQPQAKRFYQKIGFEHLLSYQLDFERIYPEYRGIEIWKKELSQ